MTNWIKSLQKKTLDSVTDFTADYHTNDSLQMNLLEKVLKNELIC